MGCNFWFAVPGHHLRVYARFKGWRVIEGRWVDTIELSTIDCAKPGKGHFTAWLPEFEDFGKYLGRAVYVENVMLPRFKSFWSKRGYTAITQPGVTDPISFPMSFWKEF